MKKSGLLFIALGLVVLPSTASATFSVIQDSCTVFENTITTHFSVVNFNSPTPICGLEFVREGIDPGCVMIACTSAAGWSCLLDPPNSGAVWSANTEPDDCVGENSIKRGFSFTLDPEFCCYLVTFLGPQGEELATQEECFDCVKVATEETTWGNLKKIFE